MTVTNIDDFDDDRIDIVRTVTYRASETSTVNLFSTIEHSIQQLQQLDRTHSTSVFSKFCVVALAELID